MSTPKRRKKKAAKRLLTLPDLEHAKIAVLNSLTSASGQRTYEHAIREFVAWNCSEPCLAFNRTVVLRYRIHLEQRHYAPATINLRLAAVRRIAYEAPDAGLLSPELAAGIRRVKGVRRLGVRLGNWLTAEQGRRLVHGIGPTTLRGLRDHAMVALLLGCGLRRGEALGLALESIQQREEHWVIADLVGKGGHIRTVPMPAWVKTAVDAWIRAAGLTQGRVFRAINKAGRVWGDGMTAKVLWDVVRRAAAGAGIDRLAPHDLRRTCARLCHLAGRRTRSNPVSPRACLDSDDGTLSRLQAEAAARRERHDGARTRHRCVTEPGRTSDDRPSLRDFSRVIPGGSPIPSPPRLTRTCTRADFRGGGQFGLCCDTPRYVGANGWANESFLTILVVFQDRHLARQTR